jgi:hypothetical protein
LKKHFGVKVIVKSQNNPQAEGSLHANVKSNAWQTREVVESMVNSNELSTLINTEDRYECHLINKGDRLQHFINGKLMSEVLDEDIVIRKISGLLSVQVHVGPPMNLNIEILKYKRTKIWLK